MRTALRCVCLSAWAACAPPIATDVGDLDLPRTTPTRTAAFVLTWEGARIGHAVEELVETARGYELTRLESIAVRRASVIVRSRTDITIRTDRSLRALRVDVTSEIGATRTSGSAHRSAEGEWIARWGNEPPFGLPARAVPAELVLYQLAADKRRSFAGTVFLAGYGFARARLRIEPDGPARVRATATTELGTMASTISLTPDGGVGSVVSSQPLAARRATRAYIDRGFDPPEIVDSSAIPLAGAPSSRIVIEGVSRPPPDELPGQRHTACGTDWLIEAPSARVAPDRHSLVVLRALARKAASLLADGVDAPAATASQALALGRGDCTSHARVFAELARERGFDVQLVTGYRADGARMVRHRWAIAHTSAGWVSVDPTWGEAPIAAGAVVALAVHGDSAREIGIADELAFQGLSDARARYVDRLSVPPCARSTARTPRSSR